MSETPEGVKGSLGSVKSHAPSGLRMASRSLSPGGPSVDIKQI